MCIPGNNISFRLYSTVFVTGHFSTNCVDEIFVVNRSINVSR